MATTRKTRARTQRVSRARDERERQRERETDEAPMRERDDRPTAREQDKRVEFRGPTWEDDRDYDRGYRDDGDDRDRYHGLTTKKRDVERIASAWTRASARLFAGTTDVLSNLVENLSDTVLSYRGDDGDRGRPRYRDDDRSRPGYRSSSRRGGRDRHDRDDDYGRSYRSRGGRYSPSRFADRADDFATDLSTAVRDAARVFTRAAESFSRVYEDYDDSPRRHRGVYRDDDNGYDDSSHREEEEHRGGRLTVDTGPKHFALKAESKDRGEEKPSPAGEESPEESKD